MSSIPGESRRSRHWFAILIVIAALLVGIGGFVYLGMYNIAADEKHWQLTERFLNIVRERSVTARASRISDMPELENADLISNGAGQYAEMCVECHLAPGRRESALRQGLYPIPPDLTKFDGEPRAAFWIIKHGIKMTGMPAWGPSHDDATIWSIVAFLRKLPSLDTAAYKRMTGAAAPDEHMRGSAMPGKGDAHDAKPHSHSK